MKMKILLLTLTALYLLLRLVLGPIVTLVIATGVVAVFYYVTRDRANTFRISLLVPIPLLEMAYALILAVVAILLNDEYLRKIWRWRFIVFTGCDGSGKSTHAIETAKWLRELGIDAIHIHFFRHPLTTLLSKLKSKVVEVRPSEVMTYTPEFRQHIRRHILPRLRPFIQYVDLVLYICSKLILNFLRGRWVIADRYFYDYFIRFKCLGYPVPKFLEYLYYYVVPKPSLVIVFDVPPEVSYERRKEHPLWYYKLARREYLRLSKLLGAYVLETLDPFPTVQRRLCSLLTSTLLKPRRVAAQKSRQ